MQNSFDFPQSLTEKYRPHRIDDFVGIPKAKKLCANLIQNPRDLNLIFCGPSGTGKTTLALALAEMLPAELHHIPSQNCTLETITRVRQTCQYVPMSGFQQSDEGRGRYSMKPKLIFMLCRKRGDRDKISALINLRQSNLTPDQLIAFLKARMWPCVVVGVER